MGYPDPGTISTLDHALQSLKDDPNTVMVISTDWQHYRPAASGSKMDSLGIKLLEKLDADALERDLARWQDRDVWRRPGRGGIESSFSTGSR